MAPQDPFSGSRFPHGGAGIDARPARESWIQNKQAMPWVNGTPVIPGALVPNPPVTPIDPTASAAQVQLIPPFQAAWLDAGYPPGVLYQYVWESPYFDLRPDLKSVDGQPKEGVPIWNQGARLYVHLSGTDPRFLGAGRINVPTPSGSTILSAWARENYNPNRIDLAEQPSSIIPGIIVGMGSWINISHTLFPPTPNQQLGSTEAIFNPPGTGTGQGAGHPIRYWQVLVQFTQFVRALNADLSVAANPPTPVAIEAAVY